MRSFYIDLSKEYFKDVDRKEHIDNFLNESECIFPGIENHMRIEVYEPE